MSIALYFEEHILQDPVLLHRSDAVVTHYI